MLPAFAWAIGNASAAVYCSARGLADFRARRFSWGVVAAIGAVAALLSALAVLASLMGGM
jgi:hypothetical protein